MFKIPDLSADVAVEYEHDRADLVTLAELAAEGFGYGSPYVTTPRDAVDALARQLGDDVIVDDIGRRAIPRQVARELFAERDQAERKQREVHQHNEAQLVEQSGNNAHRGIPADEIPEGVHPATWLLQTAKDAEPRRQSVLEHALANRDGSLTFHPIREEES